MKRLIKQNQHRKKAFITVETILSFSIALLFVFGFYQEFSSNSGSYIRSAVAGLNDSAAGKHPGSPVANP